MDHIVTQLAPNPTMFTQHLSLVQDYVRDRSGAHGALVATAQADPEGLTMSLVALGAVLLDIAAGAYKLSPEAMLDKLAEGVADMMAEKPAL